MEIQPDSIMCPSLRIQTKDHSSVQCLTYRTTIELVKIQIPNSSGLTQLDFLQPGAKDPTSTVLHIPGPTDAMIPKGILTALYSWGLFYTLDRQFRETDPYIPTLASGLN